MKLHSEKRNLFYRLKKWAEQKMSHRNERFRHRLVWGSTRTVMSKSDPKLTANKKGEKMKQQTVRNLMIAGLFGIVLLAGCSTNPVPASRSNKIATTPPEASMGGMMGFSGVSVSEKSYGVIVFDRPNGFRFRSVIDGIGDSFSNTRIFSYYTGSRSGCLPLSSSLTVGVAGTVRFTRKDGELLARVVLRTRSGKIVPNPDKRPKNSCSKEFPQTFHAKNVSEKILTKLVPVIPGNKTCVGMGKTTVTVSLDKDFPVEHVPVYPAFTSPAGEDGAFGGDMGSVSGKFGR